MKDVTSKTIPSPMSLLCIWGCVSYKKNFMSFRIFVYYENKIFTDMKRDPLNGTEDKQSRLTRLLADI